VDHSRWRVAVVGAGPAGLMAAEVMAQAGIAVTVYDRMPSAGRKFLMAGRGGLNLTHSEPLEKLLARYGSAAASLRPAIEAFPPERLRAWSQELGQDTFVGSSGRVFPTALKASPLLRAWLARLVSLGVSFKMRHHWSGWDEQGRLLFAAPDGEAVVEAGAVVFALGGASWPRLGSDGGWTKQFADAGIEIAPLQPANSGFLVDWSETFKDRFEGQPLKRIALSFRGEAVRGEALITRQGIEGGAIYVLSGKLRDAITRDGQVTLHIALRPDASSDDLIARLDHPRGKQSFSTFLRKALKLSPQEIGLLNEVTIAGPQRLSSMKPAALAQLINAVPLRLSGIASIARAISSAGGISFVAVDDHFMLRERPGTFVAGEMLDWEAPTGGYLLQACFSTGASVGDGVLKWLDSRTV